MYHRIKSISFFVVCLAVCCSSLVHAMNEYESTPKSPRNRQAPRDLRQKKHSSTKPHKVVLSTSQENHQVLNQIIQSHSNKDLYIVTSDINTDFVKNTLIPWLTHSEQLSSTRIYTSTKNAKTLADIFHGITKEIRKAIDARNSIHAKKMHNKKVREEGTSEPLAEETKRKQQIQKHSDKGYEEERKKLRMLKTTHVFNTDNIVLSNTLIRGDIFITGSFPWLAVEAPKPKENSGVSSKSLISDGKEAINQRHQTLYMSQVIKGKKSRRYIDDTLTLLDQAREATLKTGTQDYAKAIQEAIKEEDLDIESDISQHTEVPKRVTTLGSCRPPQSSSYTNVKIPEEELARSTLEDSGYHTAKVRDKKNETLN